MLKATLNDVKRLQEESELAKTAEEQQKRKVEELETRLREETEVVET